MTKVIYVYFALFLQDKTRPKKKKKCGLLKNLTN